MATRTAAIARAVVSPAISIIRRTRTSRRACSALGSGKSVSVMQGPSHSAAKLQVTVAGDEGSRRLDRVLAAHLPELSRSRLKALILEGSVSIGAVPIRDPAYHVGKGD